MTEPFVQTFQARWPDMDFNQHMRNAAYLGCAEDTRVRFMDSHGFGMAELVRHHIGPVVVEDRLVYRREIRLLETFTVDLRLAADSTSGRKMRVRNTFTLAADGAVAAVVDSVVLWFDLVARKPVTPPPALRDLWLTLPRTEDYEDLGA